MDKMSTYTSVPLDDESGGIRLRTRRAGSIWGVVKSVFLLAIPAIVFFVFGLAMGRFWELDDSPSRSQDGKGRLLKQQEFIGESMLLWFERREKEVRVENEADFSFASPNKGGKIRVSYRVRGYRC